MRKLFFSFLLALFLLGQPGISAMCFQYGPLEITLSVSSILPDSKFASYGPANLFDNNLNTAWIEGQKGTKGATITFNFNKEIIFCGFKYILGYIKSKETYKNNSIPLRCILTLNNKQHEIWTYIKMKLTGFDPEIDDKPAFAPDINDPENYSYQYVIVKPERTRRVSLTIAWASPAKYDDTGFTELHPIYFVDNQLYCGEELATQPIIELCHGIKNAQFTPIVQIPKKNYQKGNFADYNNRFLKNDGKEIKANELSIGQKNLFFPYDESFRIYDTESGFRITSLVEYGFWECDTPHGILKRNIYLIYQAGYLLFSKVEYQDEQWTY